MADIYHSPEAHGLQILAFVQAEPDYNFDMTVAWLDENGRVFVGQDSGCSCPSPFEDYHSVADLDLVTAQNFDIVVATPLRNKVNKEYSSYKRDEVDAFIRTVRALVQ